MAALGNQAGVALHRVRLMGESSGCCWTPSGDRATIDAKDGYTHRHSERVATLARRLALEIGLTADEQQTAELSALLHDVGKIAVPDAILNKPGRLTEAEFDEMRKHPLHGARIISNIQSPAVTAVLPGVKYHHERWDGSGYPGRAARRADSAARPAARGRGFLRCDDLDAPLSCCGVAGGGARAAPRTLGHALRCADRGRRAPPLRARRSA